MRQETLHKLLKMADDGASVAAIARDVALQPRRVYAVLAEHRPDRPRKRRPRTSKKRRAILALEAQGFVESDIASAVGVSRQYVYKILAEVRG
jgi:DNA invertase Pin-like site-specific DNA recombinase